MERLTPAMIANVDGVDRSKSLFTADAEIDEFFRAVLDDYEVAER